MPQVVCEMWNVKMLAMFKTANVCVILAIWTLSDLFSKRPKYFSLYFQQVFYKSFFGRNLLFHFFVAVVYNTSLQEKLHSNNVAALKLFGRVAAL